MGFLIALADTFPNLVPNLIPNLVALVIYPVFIANPYTKRREMNFTVQ